MQIKGGSNVKRRKNDEHKNFIKAIQLDTDKRNKKKNKKENVSKRKSKG